jgi:Uma2 family endonuclease
MSVALLHTPEELLHLDGLYELVDGQLVEKQVGYLAGKCIARISHVLQIYLDSHPVGEIAAEVTFQCFPSNPDQVRRPDLAFISKGRADAAPDEGHVKIAPDIAIEVISPGDKMNDFEEKMVDYRSAGVKQVWEVNPTFRFVRIHRPDFTTVFLQSDEVLSAEVLLPGFAVRVADLMPKEEQNTSPTA